LSPRERKVVRLRARGFSTNAIVESTGIPVTEVHSLNRRLKRLRDLIPEPAEVDRLLRQQRQSEEPTRIDAEIERLDFAPLNGKDCTPCWRCMYFYGFTPAKYRPTKLANAELQTAVQNTEQRKISIATER
jgi:hypothetical protein